MVEMTKLHNSSKVNSSSWKKAKSSPMSASNNKSVATLELKKQIKRIRQRIQKVDKRKLSLREKIADSIQKVIQLLRLYDFDDIGYNIKPTLDHWTKCATECGFMAFMKYKLAAFYAACQGEFFNDPQEIPAKPFTTKDTPHILLGGRAYRYVRFIFQHKPELFHGFLVSVLQIKKGLVRPDAEELTQGAVDTFKTLTTPYAIPEPVRLFDWADLKDNSIRGDFSLLTNDMIKAQIVRTVREVFDGKIYSDSERYTPHFPSTSANYIRSRTGGGAVGEILSDPQLMEGLKYDGNRLMISLADDNIFQINESDLSKFYHNWKVLYDRMFAKAIPEQPFAEPVALAEALKVRVITKGPPMLNTVLKPLQIFMWSTMKEHPVFKLIGSWITMDYLSDSLGATLKGDFAFLSVDYKNATNELRGDLSKCCAEAISDCINLTSIEKELFIRALVDHLVVDPLNDKHSEPQQNGQLMGSIVSFPVLCLINAAILRLVRELDCDREFKLAVSGVIVNGDDGLLKATPLGVRLWKTIGSFCGLKPSIGKVYYSKRFFNINSTTFEYTHDVVQEEFVIPKEYYKVISDPFDSSWGKSILKNYGTVNPLTSLIKDSEEFTKGRLTPQQIARLKHYKIEVEGGDITKLVNPVLVSYNKRKKIYFKLVKYINFGLLYDMSRSTNDETNSTTPPTSIGERANELLRTSPDSLKEKILSFYMGRHLDLLVKLNVPWYIPAHLGGLGITPLPGTRHMPTNLQLRIATKAYLCEVKFPLLRPTDCWRTWKLAMKFLPSDQFDELEIYKGSASLVKQGVLGLDKSESLVNNSSVWSLTSFRSLLVVQTLFNQSLNELKGKLNNNKHTIEMNYYRKLARANETVSSETRYTGMPLSKIQPFTVGKFPLPRNDFDNVPFIRSTHPLYNIIFDNSIDLRCIGMVQTDKGVWSFE